MKFSTATVGLTAYHVYVTTVSKKMSICDIASVTVRLSETNRMTVTGHFSDSTVTFDFEYCTNISLQVSWGGKAGKAVRINITHCKRPLERTADISPWQERKSVKRWALSPPTARWDVDTTTRRIYNYLWHCRLTVTGSRAQYSNYIPLAWSRPTRTL